MRERVILESPFGTRADGTRCTPEEMYGNRIYLDRCIADSLERGEAPFASHGFYPRALDDATPDERRAGMESGFSWGAAADLCAVYTNRGISSGMIEGVALHIDRGIRVVYRGIGAVRERAEVELCRRCDHHIVDDDRREVCLKYFSEPRSALSVCCGDDYDAPKSRHPAQIVR